ncbi:nonsense-mediated mRNA decay protein 2 [[Candida] anglica]|uniref:Nonsense-mediated mRNA decay protein 2 n=1 Tax=[Candida] anglica TaxID=148631 RepID=A0ABP0EA33_9ASCO
MSEEVEDIRRRLKDLNERAWDGEVVFVGNTKLDSSLKKNTAFVKKIKTSMCHDQCQSILKDIRSLSLEKYLSEMISSISEGLVKVTKSEDIVASMEIISALHQRFSARFSPLLLSNILNSLSKQGGSSTTETESARLNRTKTLVKLLAEYNFMGVFRTVTDVESKDDLPMYASKSYSKIETLDVIIPALKDLLNEDINSGKTLPLAVSFLKRFRSIIATSEPSVVDDKTRQILRQIYEIYSAATLKSLVSVHKKRLLLEVRIKKTSIRIGRIPEELIPEREQYQNLFDLMKSSAEYFCEVFEDLTMPLLGNEVNEDGESVVEIVKSKSTAEDELGIWESVEVKSFYTKVPDITELLEQYQLSNEDEKENGSETGTASTTAASSLSSAQQSYDGEKMRDFIDRLDRVGSQQEIDSLAVEFNTSRLNNKASKNRIFKYFLDTQEISKLKFFARFMAINAGPLSEVISELVDYLDRGFRTQIFNSKSRLNFKNIFFFCEFIRFKLVPTHVIFHKIRTLTINISATNNLDILSVFYEQCGRFLLHEPEYHELMEQMVTLLKQKRTNEQFSINDKMAINNLLVVIDPPATKVSKINQDAPKLSPKAQFMHWIIRVELKNTPSSTAMVVKFLEKFDFANDLSVRESLLELFCKPDMVNYDVISKLAIVLCKLSISNFALLTCTIDTVVEEVERGLEITDYRLNRARVAQMKYVAELYNRGALNWRLVESLLYKVINTGHPNNQPLPNSSVETDLPDNYFRIHLCCVLLMNIDTKKVPKSMDKEEVKIKFGEFKTSLEAFVAYFEFYIFCKRQPIPVETQFKIKDMYGRVTRENYKPPQNIGEAIANLQAIIKKRGEGSNAKNDPEKKVEKESDIEEEEEEEEEDEEEDEEEEEEEYDEEEDEDDDEDDDEEDDDDDEEDDEDDEEDDEDEDEEEEEEDDEDDSFGESEDEIDLTQQQKLSQEDKKIAEELEKDFQKIVLDSYQRNKLIVPMSKSKFSIPVPSKKYIDPSMEQKNENKNEKPEHVPFTLISKKGKKTSSTRVLLPSDSKFSEIKLKGEEDQRNHRERIMQLVNNMDD